LICFRVVPPMVEGWVARVWVLRQKPVPGLIDRQSAMRWLLCRCGTITRSALTSNLAQPNTARLKRLPPRQQPLQSSCQSRWCAKDRKTRQRPAASRTDDWPSNWPRDINLMLSEKDPPRAGGCIFCLFLSVGVLASQIHCNLVITLILGAKQNERYNETSVIMKCTFWMAQNA